MSVGCLQWADLFHCFTCSWLRIECASRRRRAKRQNVVSRESRQSPKNTGLAPKRELMKLAYEGKAKKLFETDNPNELFMEFKDDATAFNGQKHASFEKKGLTNKKLTTLIYEMLEKAGVNTHFIKDAGENAMVVKRVKIILIEVVVRNVIAGSLAKRTGLAEGTQLSQPIVEYYYKDDDLGDPLINEEHIRELKLATPDEIKELHRQALMVNEMLTAFFAETGIRLIDFKLEFGRDVEGNVILADEITPDTCRFWDAKTGEKLDKDRFRQDLGDMMSSYEEVLNRVQNALHS